MELHTLDHEKDEQIGCGLPALGADRARSVGTPQ
jgi:hypothetical protein